MIEAMKMQNSMTAGKTGKVRPQGPASPGGCDGKWSLHLGVLDVGPGRVCVTSGVREGVVEEQLFLTLMSFKLRGL